MTLKYCKCGAVVGDSYQVSKFISFEKWTCTCLLDFEKKIKSEKKMKQKIKIKILKFLITENNFYDRERLMQLSERSLYKIILAYFIFLFSFLAKSYKIFYCKLYRKFLKLFVEKKS